MNAGKASRKFWIAPLILFVLYACYLLWAQGPLLFGPFALPTGDNAADDMLIIDAEHLRLLHGNYSRFGFYHPGPWFLLVAAAGEKLFYGWTRIFHSYLAAQSFISSLGIGAALSLSCRLWLLVTRRVYLALLSTGIMAATILAPLSPANPLILPFWTPYAALAASLMAATGLAGVLLRGTSWLPLLVLGSVQLIHAHAGFLGIMPMILSLALLLAGVTGRLPFQPRSLSSIKGWVNANAISVCLSAAICFMFAIPILLDMIVKFPGLIGYYIRFAGKLPPQRLSAAMGYIRLFVPVGGSWLLLFLLPVVNNPAISDVRAAGLIVFFSASVTAFWYSWRQVDDVANLYLLLWFLPFVGTALVAALLVGLRARPLQFPLRMFLCCLALVVACHTVAGVDPKLVMDVAANQPIQRAADLILAESAPSGNDRIELSLDQSPDAWLPVWSETVAVLAALKRHGRRDFCIAPVSWVILFDEANRCDPGRDRIVGRRYVTLWSHRNQSLAPLRFNLSVMQMPSRPMSGQAVMSENYQGVAIK